MSSKILRRAVLRRDRRQQLHHPEVVHVFDLVRQSAARCTPMERRPAVVVRGVDDGQVRPHEQRGGELREAAERGEMQRRVALPREAVHLGAALSAAVDPMTWGRAESDHT